LMQLDPFLKNMHSTTGCFIEDTSSVWSEDFEANHCVSSVYPDKVNDDNPHSNHTYNTTINNNNNDNNFQQCDISVKRVVRSKSTIQLGNQRFNSRKSWLCGEEDLLHTSKWVPDAVSKVCLLCLQDFTLLKRRHHCRICGLVVCHSCSPYSAFIPSVNANSKVRICKNCFSSRTIKTEPPTPQQIENDVSKLTSPLVDTDVDERAN